jgi:hypothetical protein
MRVFIAAVSALVVLGAATAAGATGSNGVAPGAPVTVRMNPDNQVANAVNQAAAAAGLGPVTFEGFHPDCTPVPGQVVICRDPALQKGKHPRASRTGPDFCVVRLDPKIGGAPHGITVLTKALKKCLR